jgi:hypothetical protein
MNGLRLAKSYWPKKSNSRASATLSPQNGASFRARPQHALIGKELVKGLLADAAFLFFGHHVTSGLRL